MSGKRFLFVFVIGLFAFVNVTYIECLSQRGKKVAKLRTSGKRPRLRLEIPNTVDKDDPGKSWHDVPTPPSSPPSPATMRRPKNFGH